MLAAVPGCGMCVSAFQRSFESSSWELKWGEVKCNTRQVWPCANWLMPYWKADLWGRARMLPLPCQGLKSWSAASGVFCRTTAPSLWVFSEEGVDAWLPFCTSSVRGHRGPAMSPLLPSQQSELRLLTHENSFCILAPGEDNLKEPDSGTWHCGSKEGHFLPYDFPSRLNKNAVKILSTVTSKGNRCQAAVCY